MEARDVEINRFSRKAAGYKQAIKIAPRAREIELEVASAVALGVCATRGWEPADTPIVDLMAGSGALAKKLAHVGFRKVTALEACPEMLPVSQAVDAVQFRNGATFDSLPAFLGDLRPGIIVSLAGFHHLIERTGTGIDHCGSVMAQAELVRTCVHGLRPGGVLLIVDILEPDISDALGLSPVLWWKHPANLEIAGVPAETMRELRNATSLRSFDEIVHSKLSPIVEHPTIQWFRNVVRVRTTVGHDDVALSRRLLRLLKGEYDDRLSFSQFNAPWLFENRQTAVEFALHKFGFFVDTPPTGPDRKAVEDEMVKVLGLIEKNKKLTIVGWNLGILAITADSRDYLGNRRFMSNVILMLCVVVLMVRLLSKVYGLGDYQGWGPMMEWLVWAMVGVLIGKWVEHPEKS